MITKGGLVKGGLAIYAFPLCDCNALGSVFNVQFESVCLIAKPPFTKAPFVNSRKYSPSP